MITRGSSNNNKIDNITLNMDIQATPTPIVSVLLIDTELELEIDIYKQLTNRVRYTVWCKQHHTPFTLIATETKI